MSVWCDYDMKKGCAKCGAELQEIIYISLEKSKVYCVKCGEE